MKNGSLEVDLKSLKTDKSREGFFLKGIPVACLKFKEEKPVDRGQLIRPYVSRIVWNTAFKNLKGNSVYRTNFNFFCSYNLLIMSQTILL